MAKTWNKGLPPVDDRTYLVRQRIKNAGGQTVTVQDCAAFWCHRLLVRHSQIHGGLEVVTLTNQWRVAPAPSADAGGSGVG